MLSPFSFGSVEICVCWIATFHCWRRINARRSVRTFAVQCTEGSGNRKHSLSCKRVIQQYKHLKTSFVISRDWVGALSSVSAFMWRFLLFYRFAWLFKLIIQKFILNQSYFEFKSICLWKVITIIIKDILFVIVFEILLVEK